MPTGIAIALPDGYVALVHPRSGLAARHGVSIVNAPGTVDAGYRGEIKVLLVNLDPRDAGRRCRRGDRIAQLVVQRVETRAVRRGRRPARLGPRRRGLRFHRRVRRSSGSPAPIGGARVRFRRKAAPSRRRPTTPSRPPRRGRAAGRRPARRRRPFDAPRTTPTTTRTASTSAACCSPPRRGRRAPAAGRRGHRRGASRCCWPARTARRAARRSPPRATATSGTRCARRSPPRSPGMGGTATEQRGPLRHRAASAWCPCSRPDGQPATQASRVDRHQRPALAAAGHAARPAGRRAEDAAAVGGRAARRRRAPRQRARSRPATPLPLTLPPERASGGLTPVGPTSGRRLRWRHDGAQGPAAHAASAGGRAAPTRRRASCGRTRVKAGCCPIADAPDRRARRAAGQPAHGHAAPARRRARPRGRAVRRLRR